VTDALLAGDTLYALLVKISAKSEPAPPNDIFNFQEVGYSLAKVAEANAAAPDGWKIELLPWSCIPRHGVWNGQVAADKTFIYLFIKEEGESQACHLLRIPVGYIESPEGHIEYFATDGTWKAGGQAAGMKTLWTGELGQTVEYHPDLKEWIMVCGPGFLNNKIRIRTARELTGPWTEVPEHRLSKELCLLNYGDRLDIIRKQVSFHQETRKESGNWSNPGEPGT
jgi:hypothetical protein